AAPVAVQIDWSNIARRARQIPLAGDAISGLVASPSGASVAITMASTAAGGRGAAGGGGAAGPYVVNIDTNAVTAVPAGTAADTGAGRGGGAAAGAGGGGGGKAFSRDGRTLYFTQGSALFAAAIGNNAAA